ncbi:MAG: molecular chaperone TorD family protein [Bacteroidota bacterium]
MDHENEENARLALLRSRLYQTLAASFLHPDKEFLESVATGRFFGDTEPLLKSVVRENGRELMEDWKQMARKGPTSEQLLNSYHLVFSHTLSQTCPPCEMEYERTHVFQLTQQLADLSGFYKAFGADLVEKSGERVDHFAVQMEFMSWLTLKQAYFIQEGNGEAQQIVTDAQRKFFKDHLGRWSPLFLRKLLRERPPKFYRLVAEAASSFLEFEKNLLGVDPQGGRDTDFQSIPDFEEEPMCGFSDSCPGC